MTKPKKPLYATLVDWRFTLDSIIEVAKNCKANVRNKNYKQASADAETIIARARALKQEM